MQFLRNMFSNISRQKQVADLSRRLSDNSKETMRSALLGQSSSDRKAAEEELFAFCESTDDLRFVLRRHNASPDTLRRHYSALLAVGAGQWIRSYYIPVASFTTPQTLHFLLAAHVHNVDPRSIAIRLIEYFESGETGFIEGFEL